MEKRIKKDLYNQNIFTIPAVVSFTDVLAKGLIEDVQENPAKLSTYLILLPTRRACRSLQEAFLRQSAGKPLLLPQMKSFGDIDADDLLIRGRKSDEFNLLPAISPLERQILLSQIIEKIPSYSKSPSQNMALANSLGQLLDQVYTEGLNFSDLPNIVDRELFASHWQITLDFLSILSEHWPKILESRGVIDASNRRIKLLEMLNQQWQSLPPDYPVIAAGTTGSIPATTSLLKTISILPHGSIILPGLDQYLSEDAWENIREGHPQATIKFLLQNLDCDRAHVKKWGSEKTNESDEKITREKIFSYVMAPPKNTDQWTKISFSAEQKKQIIKNLQNIKRYDCDTPQDEAQIIALILRETLEHSTKTAALITPDRNLAKRVRALCQKWAIEIDDSGGKSLSESDVGQFMQLSAQAMIDGISPLSFLSFLKHNLNKGCGFHNFRSATRKLDKDLLRGLKPPSGFDSLLNKYNDKISNLKNGQEPDILIHELLMHLQLIMNKAVTLFSNGTHPFKKLLESHLEILEKLASSDHKLGEEILWSGETGEAASKFLSELYNQSNLIQDMTGAEYLETLDLLMRNVAIRPRYGTHPRLMILGQLEARLIQTDRVILAGLNEGVWPANSGHDPWMSRPMRQDFGLPLPERSITLSAHDFVQGACAKEVFLTRSKRIGDTPSVPARWLQRLDTYLMAIHINPETIIRHEFIDYASCLSEVKNIQPAERPAPCPPLESRPRSLSITKIDSWLKDPYSIYASQVLKLRKLNPLEKNFDVAERGTVLHAIMEQFVQTYPNTLPVNASEEFMRMAHNIFYTFTEDKTIWRFWVPRLEKISVWIVEHEKIWRKNARVILTEGQGDLEIKEGLDKPFTLTARVDRIDQINDGSIAIIDYKSGGTYSISKIENAELPQLPLEGLILEGNGFSNHTLKNKKTGRLDYWKLTGNEPAGEIITLKDNQKIQGSLNNSKAGLIQLIQLFDQEATSYIAIPHLDNAPSYNDYEHLERVKEWAALGDNESETYGGTS